MVILANKPELVAPISLLFVGDYLIQGRFFTIPFALSSVFGYLFVAGGVLMFLVSSSLLVLPLGAVMVSAGFSIWQMIRLRNVNSKLQEKVA